MSIKILTWTATVDFLSTPQTISKNQSVSLDSLPPADKSTYAFILQNLSSQPINSFTLQLTNQSDLPHSTQILKLKKPDGDKFIIDKDFFSDSKNFYDYQSLMPLIVNFNVNGLGAWQSQEFIAIIIHLTTDFNNRLILSQLNGWCNHNLCSASSSISSPLNLVFFWFLIVFVWVVAALIFYYKFK